jgi:hypothetical protein
MELNEIKILVTKYFDGETTLLEERALYDYLQSHQDLDDEMMAAKMMLSAFAQNRQIKASYEVSVPKVGRKRVSLRRWVAFAAASSVLAFVVMMAYNLFDAKSDVDSAPEFICYVDGKRVMGEQMAMAESQRIVGEVFGSVNEALMCVYRITDCASE